MKKKCLVTSIFLMLVFSLFTFTGCPQKAEPKPTPAPTPKPVPTPTPPTTIAVDRVEFTGTYEDWYTNSGEVQLAWTVYPENATNKAVTFSTTDKDVATVSSTGVVSLNGKAGGVVITVKTVDGGKTATLTKEVRQGVAAESITLTGPTQALWNNKGEDTFQLTWEVLPANATETVSFTSSNPQIVSVNETGLLTALSAGTVTITASTSGGKTDTCEVTVRDKAEVVTSLDIFAMDQEGLASNLTAGMVMGMPDANVWFFDRESNAFLVDPLVCMLGNPAAEVYVGMFTLKTDKLYKASSGYSIKNNFGASIDAFSATDEFTGIFFGLKNIENKAEFRLLDETTKDNINFDVIFLYDKEPENPVWIWQNDNTGNNYAKFVFDKTQTGVMNLRKPYASTVDFTFRAKKWRENVKVNANSYGNKTDKLSLSTTSSIEFSVQDKNGKSSYPGTWKLDFNLQGNNPLLETLAVAGAERFDFNSNVSEYGPIPLSSGTDIEVTAIPQEKTASVTINGTPVSEANDWKTNVNFSTIDANTQITVVVKAGNKASETRTYTVNVSQAITASGGVNLKVYAVDSIGGTISKGDATVKYKKSGDTVENTATIPAGSFALLNLDPNALYDFEVLGYDLSTRERYTGSRINNYFVSASGEQSLFVIQPRLRQINRTANAPEVLEFGTITLDGNGKHVFNKLEDSNFEIDNSIHGLYVKTHSPSAAIAQPGAGIYMSFGDIPNLAGSNGLAGTELGETVGNRTDGWTQTFYWLLPNVQLPQGKSDIVIVGYDATMNRVEHRVYANYNNAHTHDTLDFAKFTNFTATSMRVSSLIGYYGVDRPSLADELALNPVDGKSTSYRVRLSFSLLENEQPVPITGFDIYRRKEGEVAFKRVTRHLYGKLTAKATNGSVDNDSSLLENETYEYYVVAYNGSNSIVSPIVKSTVLETFDYELVSPTAHQNVTQVQAEAQSYVTKFSNPKLLTGYVDYVNMGVVILSKDGTPRYSSKVSYYPNGITEAIAAKTGINYGQNDKNGYVQPAPGTPRVGFGLSDWKGKYIDLDYFLFRMDDPRTVEDFIKVDPATGIVEFKADMFNDSFGSCPFNIEPEYQQYGVPFTPTEGSTYQWDFVQGGSSTKKTDDDYPIVCGRYLRNDDGSYSDAQTHAGNIFTGTMSATNGRLEFTVIGE